MSGLIGSVKEARQNDTGYLMGLGMILTCGGDQGMQKFVFNRHSCSRMGRSVGPPPGTENSSKPGGGLLVVEASALA